MAMASVNEPFNKKVCSEKVGEHSGVTFTPREYQIELLEAAKDHNTIACLGTGTGKTFIAVMLIREMANDVRIPFEKGGKKVIFLVPTVPLVNQQGKVLSEHTDLKVGEYYGEMQADTWDLPRWQKEFNDCEVLVMTAEICRIILHHAFLNISRVNLMIFDECHRAQGNHPYREIMRCFSQCSPECMPRVFGLSASLLNQKVKPSSLEKKICELEKTLRSTVETASDLNDMQKYGTDPNEYLVLYNPFCNPVSTDLYADILQTIDLIKRNMYHDEEDPDVVFFKIPEKCLKQVLDILNNLGIWCAFRAAELFLKEIACLLKNLKHPSNELVLVLAKTALENFRVNCERTYSSYTCSQQVNQLPHKLRRLLDIFRVIRNRFDFFGELYKKRKDLIGIAQSNDTLQTSDLPNIPFCGIVFVEQRITAFILNCWLLDIIKDDSELKFLVPDYIVGHGTNQKRSGALETSMSFKKQKQVVYDFKEKKINLLFATSVVEEGVDVPKCNVVIRFDLPKDFRSYVQSKGRARAQNSIYVVLASSIEKGMVIDNLSNYLTIEEMLMKRCHNRNMPDEEDIQSHMDDELLPPYMPVKGPGAPRITLTSSIGLVNRYCFKLPCDMATKLSPKWKIDIVVNPDTTEKEYVCSMTLPINSCIRGTIVGEKMAQKRTAKMAAALKACELLHKAGELDENFLPKSNLVDEALDELLGSLDLEEVTDGNIQPGTKQRRQVYEKEVAHVFKDSLPKPGMPCYLHVLEMKLVEPLPKELNRRNRPIVDPSDTSLGFGILSRHKIPNVCEFPIFTRSGKVVVGVKCVKSGIYYQDDLSKLSEFHNFVFTRALYLGKNMQYNPLQAKFSLFVVPVNKDSGSNFYIDWDFISYTMKHDFNSEICKSKADVTRPKFKEEVFINSVVTRTYMIDNWGIEAPVFHFVNKIVHELSPNSAFSGNEYGTFKRYYKMKYGMDIHYDDQPLLDTERIVSINLWKPIFVSQKQLLNPNSLNFSKAKQRAMDFREYLVPELCIIHPFPSTLFRKAMNLPTILFRLNALLLSEQLRRTVSVSMSLGLSNLPGDFNWPAFEFETSNRELKLGLNYNIQCHENSSRDILKSASGDEIISFDVQPDIDDIVGPNPSIILQALTSKSANDEFNLERLETIGDSFLKYAMSIKIYVSYPLFDEGKLTRLRSGLVRNLNLYKLAKNKLIPECLVCDPFDVKSTWIPPGFVFDDDSELILSQQRCKKRDKTEATDSTHFFTKQVISDKCVADSAEALIGAYLLQCGHFGARSFMLWMGLDAYPSHTEEEGRKCSSYSWPPVPESPMFSCAPSAFKRLSDLTNGMERFESIINYHFKNRAYLLQAFTHASYINNDITDCFQRLEFLGDAVLDFLITRKLYEDPKQHKPGDLTDLRSALVNNEYFAALAIKFQFHKHLKMLSPTLFRLIEDYIERMKASQAYQQFEAFGYFLEEVECFDIEEVEVPKALGDVFESVAGAIFLDSGMSLDAVWKAYYPMMKPAIDHMSKYIPKSPVRRLLEMLPGVKLFGNLSVSEGRVSVDIILPSGDTVTGTGPNKHVAKSSAAKRAISFLKAKHS